MEKQQTFLTIFKVILSIMFSVLFVFYIVQVNSLESRVIKLQQTITQLKDDSAKANSSLRRINQGLSELETSLKRGTVKIGTASTPLKPIRKYLHPELPNFLEPDPFNYVCEEAVQKGKVNGTLRRRYATDPKGFNFLLENAGTFRNKIEKLCLEPAAFSHWNDPTKFAPRLAERMEVIDDYKTWIVYFRQGARWHLPSLDWSNPKYQWIKKKFDSDDREIYVSAHDFAFFLDMVRNPQVEAGALKNYYADIAEYKVVDDYTLIVKWSKKMFHIKDCMTEMFRPIARFLYLYDENGKPIPKENLGIAFNNHWFNHNFAGCGAYKFVSYRSGVSIKLTRNEDYWGPKPQIKDIIYLIYRDPEQVLLKMKSQEQDFADVIKHTYVVEEKKKPNSPFAKGDILVKNVNVVGYLYIGWNSDNPRFADKRVRQAMTHALNRKTLLKNIVHGLGILITGPIYPRSYAYNQDIKPYRFDLDKAADLLKEAGWIDSDNDGVRDKIYNGEKLKFEFSLLVWNTSPKWQTMAKIYKEDLYKIGVLMNIRPLDWAVFQKQMNNKEFDAFSGYWLINYEVDPYQLWHSSQADIPKGSNRVGFRNKRADEIIEIARQTFDKKKRKALFHEFHQIIHEEQPYTFFYAPIDEAVYWKHVKNVIFRKERPHTLPLPYYIDR